MKLNSKRLFVATVAMMQMLLASAQTAVEEDASGDVAEALPAVVTEETSETAPAIPYDPKMSLSAVVAQPLSAVDSLKSKRFFRSYDVKPYKFSDDMTYVGVPLFGAGLLLQSQRTYFRQDHTNPDAQAKDRLLTNFHSTVDNYTQLAPFALATGLKLCGVDGRSDWGRYLVSAGLSYAIMAAIVNPIKYSAKQMRPDGSTRNSFPSGHTATAFASATILHKEYGLTHSTWYSVGAYTCATATGVMRVLNNRHWVSDVFAGAGIGIFSTELAYGIGDLLFKGKGLRRTDKFNYADVSENPSFYSIGMGVGFSNHDLTFKDTYDGEEYDFPFDFRPATVVSAEGAYFINKYIGFGGRLSVRTVPVGGFGDIYKDVNEIYEETRHPAYWQETFDGMSIVGLDKQIPIKDFNVTIESDHITEFVANLGVYFNIPVTPRFAIGTKALVGRSVIDDVDLDVEVDGNRLLCGNNTLTVTDQSYNYKWDLLNIRGDNTMTYGTGISFTYAYRPTFSWRLFADYDYSRKHYTMTLNPVGFYSEAFKGVFSEETVNALIDETCFKSSLKRNMHHFTIGGAFCISF